MAARWSIFAAGCWESSCRCRRWPTSELAGVEWYDSGIGFAVPLEDINKALPRLEKGEDLRPGLLGISMKPGDMFADPAEIAAVQPNSPAYHAGFKAKDTVVEVDGHPVATQAAAQASARPALRQATRFASSCCAAKSASKNRSS